MSEQRRAPRTVERLLGLITKQTGMSPAAIAHAAPQRRERLVQDALVAEVHLNAAQEKRDRKARRRRLEMLRAARGRAEPGHPGCTCTGHHTTWEGNLGGHRSDCPAWNALTAWSREDDLEALYGGAP